MARFFGCYMFPHMNKTEMHEAAARLCIESLESGRWVGVSYHRLCERMGQEYQQNKAYIAAVYHNQNERCRVENAQYWWRVKTIFTLGLYGLFVKKPTPNFVEEPADAPFSIIYVLGKSAVDDGLKMLIDRNLVRIERRKEGEHEFDVLYPTPALIELGMGRKPTVH